MAVGRSPAVYGRRRSSKKIPPTPTTRSAAQEMAPLPSGTEVEVRIDDEGFFGSWFEATVVGFEPAGGRGSPARYTVTYSHLVSEDGPDVIAVSHVRPRPPPPSGPGSSSSTPAPAPGFLLHDFVEVFDCNGWWSGIVVDPVPDPGAPVPVAFPITREVVKFPPHLVRRRRDYVGGEWVPSLAVIAIQPKRGVRVYKAGEKVEVLRERKSHGDSWFPAAVTKVVDKLSYIVEYLDGDQEGGVVVKEYLHWGYIRPAQYHRPRESKVHLGAGAAVEVYCDGAWSQGVVCRVDREGSEYVISVNGDESKQVLTKTKAAEQLRPLYMWNGRHWTTPSDKIQTNSRQQSAFRKHPCSVDATPNDDEHSCDPESSAAKKSRREPQLQKFISDEGSEHVSASQTCDSLSASCKSLAGYSCPSSFLPLSEKNGLSVFPHKVLSVCSAPPEESIPNAIGEKEFSRDIASSLRNQQTQDRPLSVKALSAKKGVSKNKRGGTRPVAHQGKNDASCHMKVQLNENNNLSALCAAAECQITSAWAQQVSGGIIGGSDIECLDFEKVARKEGANLLDKDLAGTINMICQDNIDAVVCTDIAATQNDDSSAFTSDNIQLRSCTFSGSPMPSRFAFSQISDDQLPFLKNSIAWSIIDAMDVFKKLPQQPHFRPLKEFLPPLREGMALGLMVTFANSVYAISQSCIADSIASFQEKIAALQHLEENGFDVQFLQRGLSKLLQIKSDHISYLTEKSQLEAQALEKTSSLSQIDEQLNQKEQTVARLEEELEHSRREAQKIAEEKEREDKELSRLKAAGKSVEEACGDAELQFQSILAELHRKSLT